jgi:SWI/SNF-related matrix-associated actin-dependent regulator of chromatin subfamily A3
MSAKRRQETIEQFSIPVEDVCDQDPCQDGDYVDDSGSDTAFLSQKQQRKGKGKATPGKGKANAGLAYSSRSNFASGDKNPKILLLSLKAGALGLNLTVANNVYL